MDQRIESFRGLGPIANGPVPDDPAPPATLVHAGAALDTPENTPVGTDTGLVLAVQNLLDRTVDGYTKLADPTGAFTLNETTGASEWAIRPDYEQATSHSMTVRATLSDGSTAAASFVWPITDIDESASLVHIGTPLNAPENLLVGTATPIQLSVQNLGDRTVTGFTKVTDASGAFTLNPITGSSAWAISPDFEAATFHDVTFRASLSDGLQVEETFRITIINSDDQRPVNIEAPTVDTPTAGIPLSASTGGWLPTPTGPVTLAWKINNVPVPLNHTPVSGDIGQDVELTLTAPNGPFTPTILVVDAGTVQSAAPPAPVNTEPPTVLRARAGSVSLFDPGLWTNNPSTYVDNWYVDDVAQGAAHTPDAGDVGKAYTVGLFASNGTASATETRSPAVIIQAASTLILDATTRAAVDAETTQAGQVDVVETIAGASMAWRAYTAGNTLVAFGSGCSTERETSPQRLRFHRLVGGTRVADGAIARVEFYRDSTLFNFSVLDATNGQDVTAEFTGMGTDPIEVTP